MVRQQSELGRGFKPVRMLFKEVRGQASVHWYCQLCTYSYWEPEVSSGWPLSVDGLLTLVEHVKSHTTGH
jgi:hypothetical protein